MVDEKQSSKGQWLDFCHTPSKKGEKEKPLYIWRNCKALEYE